MKIDEIRHNNIVRLGYDVYHIDFDGVDSMNYIQEDIHLLKGINLTEELFTLNGWERFPWGFVREVQDSEEKILIAVAKDYFFIEAGNGFNIKIEYLHQLQNIYFHFTGFELPTKINEVKEYLEKCYN